MVRHYSLENDIACITQVDDKFLKLISWIHFFSERTENMDLFRKWFLCFLNFCGIKKEQSLK